MSIFSSAHLAIRASEEVRLTVRILTILLGALVASGCAGPELKADLPVDHPASSDAPEATMPPPSDTLAVPEQGGAVGSVEVRGPGVAAGTDLSRGEGHSMSGAHHDQTLPATQPSTTQAAYACPMHSDVTSDTPGKCPKCGMSLVRTTRRREMP
jgi:hypothetical protein